MLRSYKRGSFGFSLPELMIALLMGLFVMLGVLSSYMATSKGNIESIRMTRLTQESRSAMRLMAEDIRRAGYWSQAHAQLAAGTDNPFLSGQLDVSVSNKTGEADGSCILYSYDVDADGIIHDGSGAESNDMIGFRLSDQRVQMRVSGADFNCNDGLWVDVTDGGVTAVTGLSFLLIEKCINATDYPNTDCAVTLPDSGDRLVRARDVKISYKANLLSDSMISRSLEDTVHIRNDKIELQP